MKEKGLIKQNNNQEILLKLSNEDMLYELETDEIKELSQFISDNINLKALERAITKATLKLSGVSGPSFMADAKWLALDNQKRLELIYMLTNNFQLLKADLSNYRKNKFDLKDNPEGLLNFILNTREILKTVQKYQEFRIEEKVENQKQLDENKRRLLNQ